MKNVLKLAAAAFFALMASHSQASSITDGYIGSNAHGYGDVIGDTSTFQINGATITRVGTVLTIVISTNFAGNAGVDASSAMTKGIGYGDVFLSSIWNAAGTSSTGYATDNSSTGTVWDYGLSLNNRYSNTGGTFSLYQLNGSTNAQNILDSDDVMTCTNCTYRDGQEDIVNTKSSTVTDTGIDGTWAVNNAANTITFKLDLSGSDMLNWDSFAMHWGETCQNDVIEGMAYGVTKIPLPGSAALLLLGLGALGIARRRRSV